MVILGIGNVLQKDDGFGVYASAYLERNYDFFGKVEVVNGGVEGINLYNIFEQNINILILDTIEIDDQPASIYQIPSYELSSRGLNSGGAHEIGVLECIDMLELQGKKLPKATILGIIPRHITFEIDLSQTLKDAFDGYIKVALNYIKNEGFEFKERDTITSLEEIIKGARLT